MPTWLAAIARVLLVLAMPVVLLLSPLYLFVTPAFVRHEYTRQGFPPSERFAPEERLRLSDTIVHYLRGRASREEMASMRTDRGEVALLKSEVQHLVDVKIVMDAFWRAHGIGLVVALLCLIVLWASPARPSVPIALRQGVWITAGLIAAIVTSSFIDFDLFFTRFHEMFFSAGSWLFYETDTLIQLYPLPFWVDAVWKIGAVVLVEMAAIYGVTALARF